MWILSPLTFISSFLCKKYIKTKLDISSFIYSLYTSYYAHYIYYLYSEIIFTNKVCISNKVQHIYWITNGYSVYELYHAIANKHYGYMIHSITLFLGSSYILTFEYYYYPFIFYLIQTSTIFLNLMVYKIKLNKIIFALTFIFYRLVIALPYSIYIIHDVPNFILGCIIIFNGLNIYWGVKIIKKLYIAFNHK